MQSPCKQHDMITQKENQKLAHKLKTCHCDFEWWRILYNEITCQLIFDWWSWFRANEKFAPHIQIHRWWLHVFVMILLVSLFLILLLCWWLAFVLRQEWPIRLLQLVYSHFLSKEMDCDAFLQICITLLRQGIPNLIWELIPFRDARTVKV